MKTKGDKVDPINKDWKEIRSEILNRYNRIQEAGEQLNEINPDIDKDLRFKLAATDVFVEKAQYRLTRRAASLKRWGIFTSSLTLAILVTAAITVFLSKPYILPEHTMLNGYIFTLLIIKAVSFGGFVAGAVYFLGSLSRALFHESTVLYNRRHAVAGRSVHLAIPATRPAGRLCEDSALRIAGEPRTGAEARSLSGTAGSASEGTSGTYRDESGVVGALDRP